MAQTIETVGIEKHSLKSNFSHQHSNHYGTDTFHRNVSEFKWDNDCHGSKCRNATIDIVNSLNTSVDPCINFYDFACNGWFRQNSRPKDTKKWDVFEKHARLIDHQVISILADLNADLESLSFAKFYYAKCLEKHKTPNYQRDIQFIWNKLEKYGGWPVLYDKGTWNSSRFSWIKSVVGLKKEFGQTQIVGLGVHQKADGRVSKNYLEIRSPTNESNLFNVSQFRSLVKAIADKLDTKTQKYSDSYFHGVSLKILNLVSGLTLANKHMDSDAYMFPLEELQGYLDNNTDGNQFDIEQLIRTFYEGSDVTIRKRQRVYVDDLQYLVEISQLLDWVDKEALANYLHFQVVLEMMPFLSFGINYYNKTVGEETDVQQLCIQDVWKKFPIALEYAIVQNKISSGWNDKNIFKVSNMFDNIRSEYKALIQSSRRSFVNKKRLIKKLDSLGLCAGYPSWIVNKDRVEFAYDRLKFTENMSYIQQNLAFNEWTVEKKLRLIAEARSAAETCMWKVAFGDFAPGYLTKNIYVPHGMMECPFYDETLPRPWIYGSLGSIIGHEIAHGLFGQGWSVGRNGAHTPVATCLIDQYGSYSFEDKAFENITVDGEYTLEENLCDNAGLLAAYKAYKANSKLDSKHKMAQLQMFSNDQLFFLGFAQNWCEGSTKDSIRRTLEDDLHSPKQFRILGTMQNSKEFVTAWKCPARQMCEVF